MRPRTEMAPGGARIRSYPPASLRSAAAAARASFTALSDSALAAATFATTRCGYVPPSTTPAAARISADAIQG